MRITLQLHCNYVHGYVLPQAWKQRVTMKESDQLSRVATDEAVARMWAGKSSPMMSQGIAPSPREKETM